MTAVQAAQSSRDRLLQVLACAALGPGLDGVLLFDLEPELVAPVSDAFAELLRLAHGRPPRRTVLGSVTGEDELWLRPTLRHEASGPGFTLAPGPLVDRPDAPATLVVVPDLVRLSLPGMRAAVQLLGADVAAVERSGFRARWRPGARWLAVCRGDEAGGLSPHLLDRFPLRLDVSGLRPPGDGRDRVRQSWASRCGQAGSLRRTRSVQRVQQVTPGTTSGPTSTPSGSGRSSRWGRSWRSRVSVSARSHSRVSAATTVRSWAAVRSACQ